MKKFIMGLSTGYLLTSFFSIQAPSISFWAIVVSFVVLATPVGYVWYRFNDDICEGEF